MIVSALFVRLFRTTIHTTFLTCRLHRLFTGLFVCDVQGLYAAQFDMVLQAGKTSLVRALMSPFSICDPIELDDRTVGIDRYEMQLLPNQNTAFADAAIIRSRVSSDCSKRLQVNVALNTMHQFSHFDFFSRRKCILKMVNGLNQMDDAQKLRLPTNVPSLWGMSKRMLRSR
jgi:hypothetical protein